jgi:hypothetical protein
MSLSLSLDLRVPTAEQQYKTISYKSCILNTYQSMAVELAG